ncbi:MAG TPA: hypothetical protein VF263_23170, partial [Longimicrobiaceae bacterium]
MHAFREARTHYEVALDVVAEDRSLERAALFEALGEATCPFGDSALCSRYFEEAQRLYAGAGDRVRAGDVHRRLAEAAWQRGDTDAALERLWAALTTLEAEAPGRELALAYGEMAAFHVLSCQFREGLEWGRRALELAERLGDAGVESYALNWIGCALVEVDATAEGLEHLERSLELARRSGSPSHAIRAYTNLGFNLYGLGHLRRAAEVLREESRFADDAGWESGRGRLTSNLARVEMELGDWAAAGELLDRAIRAGETGYPASLVSAVPWKAELLLRRGRPEEARALLEEVLPECERHGASRAHQAACPVLARTLLALGDPAGAADAMDRCAAALRSGQASSAHLDALECGVRVYLRAGRCPSARELLDALASVAARAPSPMAAARLADALGRAGECRGDGTAAPRFREAAAAWAEMGLPFQEGESRRRLAAVLLRSASPADREEGAREAARARALFERLGAAGELARLDALAPPEAAPARAEALSRREMEVLALLAEGR